MSSSTPLPRATPESEGIASADVLAFVDAVEAAGLELHSLMLLRHGNVLAEGWWDPFLPDDIHFLYSLSKSFCSTAIGIAIDEGRLSLDDSVISFFPAETPPNPSANLQAMKVRHLLSMSAGHGADDMSELYLREDGDWARGFLLREVPFEPGTHFVYNTSATYMLSAILQRITGETTLAFLQKRLMEPLGIEKAQWQTCPKGVSFGGSGLSVTTDSIARFGQMFLQNGLWNGERIVSEAWIADATRSHISNASNDQPDWRQGYGFQFWRCLHNCYRGDGAFGQFCVVSPEKEMVIAITASVSNMQAMLELVWEHLYLPVQSDMLHENSASAGKLTVRLQSLRLPGVVGKAESPIAAEVSGKRYESTTPDTKIKSCSYEFHPSGCMLTIDDDKGVRTLGVGLDEWARGVWFTGNRPSDNAAARGAWVADDTYEIKVRYTESPTGLSIVSKFAENGVSLITTVTNHFGPSEGPSFSGVSGE